MKRFLSILLLPVLASCPGSGAQPGMIRADAILVPVQQITTRHDAWLADQTTDQLEITAWSQQSKILRQLVEEAAGQQ